MNPSSVSAIACVILTLRDTPGLEEAVRSVLTQSVEAEVVVVSSGGRGTAERLRNAGLAVPVIEHEERLYAGAARNVGIAATRAPWISFLAADCLALTGWLAGRLEAHGAGALAVASPVVNAYPCNPVAWATQVSLFAHRMPGSPPERRLLYGLSYARELFDRFGLFSPNLRTGEDTDFNQRLAGEVEIAWSPSVRTAHRHPRTLAGLLADHHRRGVRTRRAWQHLDTGDLHRRVARIVLRRLPTSLTAAWRAAEPGDRRWIVASLPFLPLATLAYAAGALRTDDAPGAGDHAADASRSAP